LARGERPVIRSDGSPERDYLYIEDAVEAYLRVGQSLDRERLWGRAWNAGWGTPHSVLEVVERLIEVSGVDVEPDVRGEGVRAWGLEPRRGSVVCPAYTGGADVEQALREVSEAAGRLFEDYEIILVDDGSQDGTAKDAKALAARDGRIRVSCHGRNRGYGEAL